MVLQYACFWNSLGKPTGSAKVCVVDSGYKLGHVGLTQDYAYGTLDDKTWSADKHGHGTRLAGIIEGIGEKRKLITNDYDGKFELVIVKALPGGSGTQIDIMNGVEIFLGKEPTIIPLSMAF